MYFQILLSMMSVLILPHLPIQYILRSQPIIWKLVQILLQLIQQRDKLALYLVILSSMEFIIFSLGEKFLITKERVLILLLQYLIVAQALPLLL